MENLPKENEDLKKCAQESDRTIKELKSELSHMKAELEKAKHSMSELLADEDKDKTNKIITKQELEHHIVIIKKCLERLEKKDEIKKLTTIFKYDTNEYYWTEFSEKIRIVCENAISLYKKLKSVEYDLRVEKQVNTSQPSSNMTSTNPINSKDAGYAKLKEEQDKNDTLLNNKIKTLENDNKHSKENLKEEQKKSKNLENENKSLITEIEKKTSQIVSFENSMNEEINKRLKIENKTVMFSSILKSQRGNVKKLQGNSEANDIIEGYLYDNGQDKEILEDAKFLIKHIEGKVYKKIKIINNLYNFDPLNPTNFHSYIDGKNNFLIIVRSKNGLFGAFSTSKFAQKYTEPSSTESFMFTLRSNTEPQRRTFDINYRKEKAKSLQYDEYFLIVGNSEIRWRFSEKIIYSNFGINNGFYETNGAKVDALFNDGNNREDIPLITFSCFEVVFE